MTGIFFRAFLHALPCALCLASAGCGGGNGASNEMLTQNPVTVFLPISTVVVTVGGIQVSVPIQIKSTSETALVSVTGLPAGVQERYAASDTNPSGTMTFTAAGTAPTGTRMPIVTVISAGQTVNTPFTLIVKAD